MFSLKKKILLLFFSITGLITTFYRIKAIDVPTICKFEVPPFGMVNFSGNIDIENTKFTLSGSPEKKEFDLGFLKITEPSINLSSKKEFSANATVNILDEQAKLSVLKYIPNKIVIYQIDPIKKLNFPITPWTNVDIDNFVFLVKPDLYELQTNINIFNEKAILKFGKKRILIPGTQYKTIEPNIQTQVPQIQQAQSTTTIKPEQPTPNVTPDNYAEIIIKKLKPSDIIKNKALDSIKLYDSTFKIEDPFTKGKDHPITIECLANIQDLNSGLPINLSEIKSKIELNKKTGFTLTSKLEDFTMSNNIKLTQAMLTIIIPPSIKSQPEQTPQTETEKQNSTSPTDQNLPPVEIDTANQSPNAAPQVVTKPSIFLSGKTELNLPLIGRLNTDFLAQYDKGIFTFKIKIDPKTKINIANIGTFKDCILILSQTGNFEIQGTINLVDIDWLGTLKFTKANQPTTEPKMPTEQQTTAEGYSIEFSAIAKKEIYPFKNITGLKEIKQLKDIKISNPGIRINTDNTFTILGQCSLFGFKSTVTLEITQNGITLKAFPPKGWKISDAIDSLEGSLFDKIDLSNTKIVISSFSHFDPQLNVNLNMGINLAAMTNLADKTFNGAKNLISGLASQSLNLFGSLGSLKDTQFAVTIPLNIKLSEKAFLENTSFFFTGSDMGPSMGLKTQIKIIPSQDDEPLLFSGKASIDLAKSGLLLGGSMLGEWNNPLGLNGITLSNVGCDLSLPTLTTVGLTGTLIFEKNKEIGMAARYSTDGKIALMGKFKGELLLEDILSIPAKANPNFDIKSFKKNFPDIGFYDSEFKFAPLQTKIDEIIIEPGIFLTSHMKFFNDKEAFVHISLGSNGFVAQGSMSEFDLGPIKISGSGLDQKYGTKDDGPTVDFTITPEIQHLMLSGLIDIKLTKGEADILIGSEGIDIKLYGSLFNDLFEVIYELKSEGSIKNPSSLDFKFKANLSNEINDYLIRNITKNLNIFDDKTKNTIEDLIKNLDYVDVKIKKINEDIKKKNKKISELRKEYNRISIAEEFYDI